jgi:hypothetical protein
VRLLVRIGVVVALLAALVGGAACQRMVDVQVGTRTVDAQGNVLSQDVRTLRVPADQAGSYHVVTITRPDIQAQLAALYADAQKAIAGGDLTLAKAKLDQVLKLNSNYRSAKAQLDAIKAGKKPAPDTTTEPKTTKPTTPPASGEPTAVAGSLLRWVPDKMSGFSAQKPSVDSLSVSREYLPASGSSAQSLVVVAEQFRTATDAKNALATDVKNHYPKSAASLKVHGHDVYFGTDGRDFAAIAFTSGSVMIAAEASPESGSPSQLKSLLENVVDQLP